ncbi:MAG: prephenate dehydrogenase [Candidatus Limivicinus sp.]|jgi:prephenate dehydrogenase
MIVGISGLGLIGGSFAKAFKRNEHIKVLAQNRNKNILDFALLSGAADGELTRDSIGDCELLILASYPGAAAEYLRAAAPYISKKTLVMDSMGTKRGICSAAFPIAEKYGFTFVGGHPMAGTQYSGFKYSRADLFDGAPLVIVPPRFDDIELLDEVKRKMQPAGFGSVSVTTAEEHDRIIAFTSQLAHVVSNAYVKSPRAETHRGFSAGSYRDLTRVAWLNPEMWAELFIENGDNLVSELDFLIEKLGEYRDAIDGKDSETLVRLLDEGRMRKKAIDGEK